MSEALLEGGDLGRKLGTTWIWRHLDFQVNPTETLAVVGPSGSGKSLLLRAIAGLDPLDEGMILYENRSPAQWGLPSYRTRVMYLPQRPALFEGNVLDNLRLPFTLKAHQAERCDENRAIDHLEKLGRQSSFLSMDASTLSGGEGQVVALVRALLLEPQILLLDEPTASLDASTTQQAEELIAHWRQADPRRACVWASHSAEQLERVATRRLSLEAHEQPSH